jgi:nicotinate-nucleotide pyrophosphorylase (carboxylating)
MLKVKDVKKYVDIALKEDIGKHDVTTDLLICKQNRSKAYIVSRQPGVICGMQLVKTVFRTLDKTIKMKSRYKDGDFVEANTKVIFLEGRTCPLLTGERVALNFLGYLSGIATNTRRMVQAVKPHKVKVLDTRKTTPGLRLLKKYAVRSGGGTSHRFDLHEMILIKDNHRHACHPHVSIAEAIRAIRKRTRKTIEVEVDTLAQFKEALSASPDIILLDNMNVRQLKRAVAETKKFPARRRPLLEASGGITEKNIATIARTGVDRISLGTLTHSIRMLDFSMEIYD